MPRRTSYLEQKERQNKIKAMDGLLNSLPFLDDRIRKVTIKLDEINRDLEYGGIRSPSIIKDYMPDHRSVQSAHERLIMKKMEYESELNDLTARKAIIENRIAAMNPFEQKLLRLRYSDNETYDSIAAEVNLSRDAVRRALDNILAGF